MDFNPAPVNKGTAARRADQSSSPPRYDLPRAAPRPRPGSRWQPEIWRAFADELGIPGPPSPGHRRDRRWPIELMVIAEALGRTLVIEPYVGTVVVAGGLLVRAGTEAAHAPAGTDRGQHRRRRVGRRTGHHRARRRRRLELSGSAAVVTDAPWPPSAHRRGHRRGARPLTEFDAAAPPAGLTVHGYRTIDDRRAPISRTGRRAARRTRSTMPSLSWTAPHEAAAAVCAEAVGGMHEGVGRHPFEYYSNAQRFRSADRQLPGAPAPDGRHVHGGPKQAVAAGVPWRP